MSHGALEQRNYSRNHQAFFSIAGDAVHRSRVAATTTSSVSWHPSSSCSLFFFAARSSHLPGLADSLAAPPDLPIDHCRCNTSLPPVSRLPSSFSLPSVRWCVAPCQASAPRVRVRVDLDLVTDQATAAHRRSCQDSAVCVHRTSGARARHCSHMPMAVSSSRPH
jgi:hypothetical protein